jgi:hypothetical protein
VEKLVGVTMSIKEHVLQRLDTLSEVELSQVDEFVAFLKFRARFQSVPTLADAQLAAMYTACAEEDRVLAEEGMAEYVHGLGQEDVS